MRIARNEVCTSKSSSLLTVIAFPENCAAIRSNILAGENFHVLLIPFLDFVVLAMVKISTPLWHHISCHTIHSSQKRFLLRSCSVLSGHHPLLLPLKSVPSSSFRLQDLIFYATSFHWHLTCNRKILMPLQCAAVQYILKGRVCSTCMTHVWC